jgi:hypothetical protein
MHTAFDIKKAMFDIELEGRPAFREDILDWGSLDRLGVVMDRPYGALGAGLLTLLAITSFYDVAGKKRRQRPIYPEIYLFHRGGPWGNFIAFDFFPEHKEVFVDADPRAMLPAINSRGITHLVVPDGHRAPVEHRFKERDAATDRLKRCFAYGVSGDAADGDIRISTDTMLLLDNYTNVLRMDEYMSGIAQSANPIPLRLRSTSPEENRRTFEASVARLAGELRKDDPATIAADARVLAARAAGKLTETYRRIAPDEAFERLG